MQVYSGAILPQMTMTFSNVCNTTSQAIFFYRDWS